MEKSTGRSAAAHVPVALGDDGAAGEKRWLLVLGGRIHRIEDVEIASSEGSALVTMRR